MPRHIFISNVIEKHIHMADKHDYKTFWSMRNALSPVLKAVISRESGKRQLGRNSTNGLALMYKFKWSSEFHKWLGLDIQIQMELSFGRNTHYGWPTIDYMRI